MGWHNFSFCVSCGIILTLVYLLTQSFTYPTHKYLLKSNRLDLRKLISSKAKAKKITCYLSQLYSHCKGSLKLKEWVYKNAVLDIHWLSEEVWINLQEMYADEYSLVRLGIETVLFVAQCYHLVSFSYSTIIYWVISVDKELC